MESFAVKVASEIAEARFLWAEFTKGERTVTAKMPRSLVEAVDSERGILPLGLSDYLQGMLLMFGTTAPPENRR